VRVLFDHNVSKRLRAHLEAHQVSTAREMSWAEQENGDLLRIAEDAGFAVMVIEDKNLSYQ